MLTTTHHAPHDARDTYPEPVAGWEFAVLASNVPPTGRAKHRAPYRGEFDLWQHLKAHTDNYYVRTPKHRQEARP